MILNLYSRMKRLITLDNVEQSKLFQQYISNHQYVTKELIIASDEEDALRYPISISFTADITRTALKKYIDQHWDTVSTLIEKYKTTSKSVLLKRGTRSSDLKSNLRKMFIFQNRNLDADALRKMLAKQFDYRISVEQIRSEKSKILKGK
jgi:aminopeptidase C